MILLYWFKKVYSHVSDYFVLASFSILFLFLFCTVHVLIFERILSHSFSFLFFFLNVREIGWCFCYGTFIILFILFCFVFNRTINSINSYSAVLSPSADRVNFIQKKELTSHDGRFFFVKLLSLLFSTLSKATA
jgi:hypothetical protein